MEKVTTGVQNSGGAAPLYGLVLAGGRSVRMGQDKSLLHWHGVEQRYYMADMLMPRCAAVYLSCRPDQQEGITAGGYAAIPDSYPGGGPLAGLLSAFSAHTGVAWLVVACDLPLLDAATLDYLIGHRDTAAIATTFSSPFDGLPEPLITIWEPSASAVLQQHIAAGFSCPRKALIRNEDRVKLLVPPHPEKLMNANTPEDAALVRDKLKK